MVSNPIATDAMDGWMGALNQHSKLNENKINFLTFTSKVAAAAHEFMPNIFLGRLLFCWSRIAQKFEEVGILKGSKWWSRLCLRVTVPR